jgi:nucleoside-diphosphate-sugar epimerase
VVRPALLFGEHDPGNFLRLLIAVSRGRYLHVDGGRARKSLSYVGNVGPVVAALARSDRAVGRLYYLADPQPRTVREITTVISECLGLTPPRLSLAAPIARALGAFGSVVSSAGISFPLRLDMVETLVRDAIVDTRPLQEEMGVPLPISFGEGVRKTVDWCRNARIVA